MKSFACISSSVLATCQHASVCFPLSRGLKRCRSVGRCLGADFADTAVVVQQSCVAGARAFHGVGVQQVSEAPLPAPVPLPERREGELTVYKIVKSMSPTTALPLSPYSPYTKPQGSATAPVNIQSLFEEDAIPQLCSRLTDLPSNDRAEGLATLLGACVEFGLEAHSPLVVRLKKECLELLSNRDVGVAQLCHLGEVAHALEGHQSAMVTAVLSSIHASVVSPGEAVRVYSLLARCYDPDSRQQRHMLSALHKHRQELVRQLKASQVSDIMQSLLKLQHGQTLSLMSMLSHRASQVFEHFSDTEIIKMLSVLMIHGQYNEPLLAAMEEHLPGRLGKCDPELISTVMEYCLKMRCRSEPIFEAVADNFVCHAESHTTLQIAKQIVAMGRLNYLPQCSSQMFKKLESILSTRFSQFQPCTLIEMLHACIHLERFPLNYLSTVFRTYFIQRLQAQGEPLDKNVLGQLTQLHISVSVECKYFCGPRLPYFLYVKRFSTVDHAFETPMNNLLYNSVEGPLTQLLGGKLYSTRAITPSGYTIDVELCLDEEGYVLPITYWSHTHRRMALCLDDPNRFCRDSQHLLGKEVTKRRHFQKMGYEVVQIPYFEFEKLKNLEERVQYLQKKIFPTICKFNL